VKTAHDIIKLLPDDVRAEVIEGEVIVNAATPADRDAKIVLGTADRQVRRVLAHPGQ
jgi:hypothetical protein